LVFVEQENIVVCMAESGSGRMVRGAARIRRYRVANREAEYNRAVQVHPSIL
jgi:hypothetical protein